jgi:acyl carrier protein
MNSELKKILADTLGLPEEQISADASTDNTQEWDSVAHINVVLSLESRYGLSFTPDEILELNSLGKIQAFLNQRGKLA